PLLVCSDPRVPNLAEAILRGGESPLPTLMRGVRNLEAGGARCIAIACHAAHHWHDELSAAANVPILHIADAVCRAIADRAAPGEVIGLIAAASTQHSGFYQRMLTAHGYDCISPKLGTLDACVSPGIKMVKESHATDAAPLFRRAIQEVVQAGAAVV